MLSVSFNPRTRKGCDQRLNCGYADRTVSIHAPVKDATILFTSKIREHGSFNPRTRKGCDNKYYGKVHFS